MEESWSKWEPIAGLAPKYHFEVFRHPDGLILSVLDAPKKKIVIQIDPSCDEYRCTKSFHMDGYLSQLIERYDVHFFNQWTFFHIANSSYVQWIHEQSYTLSDFFEFKHYVIWADNMVLEVLSSCEPEVQIIEAE